MNIKKNTSSGDKLVWVIADDKIGHKNQAIGVAENLGYPFVVKNIQYNDKAKLPNILKGSGLTGVDIKKSDDLLSPWPDIIIAAGRKTAPISKYIKSKSKGKSFIVQLMWPGSSSSNLDLIAVPKHDNRVGKNIIETIGSPHRITDEFLSQEGEIWRKTIGALSSPIVSLLVGGNAGKKKFTASHASELGFYISELVDGMKGELLVTTSRRTPENVIKALKASIKCKNYFYEAGAQRANPYYAFLYLSDAIVVTGDSISMCSEACASGKPVFIYAPEDMVPKKHKEMHKSLYKSSYAKPFEMKKMANIEQIIVNSDKATSKKLNTSSYIADEIINRFG